ncbi:hypothetical protein GW17_00045013 [Ensete ventricosum]|nr:hypothetical protein GW17_00045013 [Ensete ventricosum]
MYRVDAVENSPGVLGSSPRVSRVFHDSAREFARRRLRLIGRLSGVTEKLAGRSSLRTRREIAGRSPEDLPQECRRLPDWRDERRVYRHRPGFQAVDGS